MTKNWNSKFWVGAGGGKVGVFLVFFNMPSMKHYQVWQKIQFVRFIYINAYVFKRKHLVLVEPV